MNISPFGPNYLLCANPATLMCEL